MMVRRMLDCQENGNTFKAEPNKSLEEGFYQRAHILLVALVLECQRSSGSYRLSQAIEGQRLCSCDE